jgi:hypothetical protein
MVYHVYEQSPDRACEHNLDPVTTTTLRRPQAAPHCSLSLISDHPRTTPSRSCAYFLSCLAASSPQHLTYELVSPSSAWALSNTGSLPQRNIFQARSFVDRSVNASRRPVVCDHGRLNTDHVWSCAPNVGRESSQHHPQGVQEGLFKFLGPDPCASGRRSPAAG